VQRVVLAFAAGDIRQGDPDMSYGGEQAVISAAWGRGARLDCWGGFGGQTLWGRGGLPGFSGFAGVSAATSRGTQVNLTGWRPRPPR
jgi:hypothetical protein